MATTETEDIPQFRYLVSDKRIYEEKSSMQDSECNLMFLHLTSKGDDKENMMTTGKFKWKN